MRERAPAVIVGTGERDRDGDTVTLEFCPHDQFAWIVEDADGS